MKYYMLSILLMLLVASCSEKKTGSTNAVENKGNPVAYELATVEKAGVSTTIKLPAELAAYQEVSIFPKINGYVKTVMVDIGSRVSKGKLLMELEAPELQQAVLQAKEKYVRSKTDFSIDKEHYGRFLEASATAGAISPLDLSTLKAKMESDSVLCNAEKINWQMQETLLGYLKVIAPFNGVITERNVHPGALVSAASKDKPMLELKEIDHLRLQIDVPGDMASVLKDNDTVSFYVSSLKGRKMTGIISRRSMNVNAQYRSERMEIDVPNKDGQLSSGMYADVIIHSKGNVNALSVPRSAVVTSTERKYVLLSRNSKITKVDISTGNETASKIEIYGLLNAGDTVILNANDEIKENY